MYDIIGDIHGHHDLLIKMLDTLGYELIDGCYRHKERKAIFTGDIINRGPYIRKTVNTVKAMVENGEAFCILGNHELNAILYSTMDKNGNFLQKHLPRFKLPLMKTLDEYKKYPEEFKEAVKWFRTLPVYLDFGSLRVVHGAWIEEHIQTVDEALAEEKKIKKSFLNAYSTQKKINTALNELIKGIEIHLPKDFLLKDNKGIIRRSFRIKWWTDPAGKTFKKIAFGNQFEMPAYTIPEQLLPETYVYPTDAPPVFIGHYCINKKKLIYQKNICCVDNCVTRTQRLVAYRWNGEQQLDEANLVKI